MKHIRHTRRVSDGHAPAGTGTGHSVVSYASRYANTDSEQPPVAPAALIWIDASSDTTTMSDSLVASLQRIRFTATPTSPIISDDRGRGHIRCCLATRNH